MLSAMSMALGFVEGRGGWGCRGEGGVVQGMLWLQKREPKWSERISTDSGDIYTEFCHQVFDEMAA